MEYYHYHLIIQLLVAILIIAIFTRYDSFVDSIINGTVSKKHLRSISNSKTGKYRYIAEWLLDKLMAIVKD